MGKMGDFGQLEIPSHNYFAPSSNHPKILIADDDPLVRKKNRRLLGDVAGYGVITAASPDESLDMIALGPDLAFIDVHFTCEHRAEGIDLVRRMRRMGYDGALCMLSFDVRWELLRDALMAGADDYHSKDDVNRHLTHNAQNLVGLFTEHDRRSPGFDQLVNGCFLRSRGCIESWRWLLRRWVDAGLPDLKVFASQLDITHEAVRQRFRKIRMKLELTNNHQLAILVGILTGYGARLSILDEENENE